MERAIVGQARQTLGHRRSLATGSVFRSSSGLSLVSVAVGNVVSIARATAATAFPPGPHGRRRHFRNSGSNSIRSSIIGGRGAGMGPAGG